MDAILHNNTYGLCSLTIIQYAIQYATVACDSWFCCMLPAVDPFRFTSSYVNCVPNITFRMLDNPRSLIARTSAPAACDKAIGSHAI